ncbi:hypothetical protein TNCV_3532061 [Trichonephila clavipes]|nr:hypothetical protein TNCV_3532061 [Trichonephila clavipes]
MAKHLIKQSKTCELTIYNTCGSGRLVVMVTESRLAEVRISRPRATEDPCVEMQMQIKSVEAHNPPIVVVGKFGEWMTAQVTSSSLDHD